MQRHCEEILRRVGRAPESFKLLAVSKLQPVEKIETLYALGQRSFAENYVQEALDKMRSLAALDIEWHLIGTLQRNKVKLIAGQFSLIHSVDSLKLAQTLSQASLLKSYQQRILLQVNIANEESKSGFKPAELLAAWPALEVLTNLKICGLMTMPPLTEDPEAVRPYFQETKRMLEHLRKANSKNHPLSELSMGTSHDYHIAIEEGATIVRLGTVLFGERTKHGTHL